MLGQGCDGGSGVAAAGRVLDGLFESAGVGDRAAVTDRVVDQVGVGVRGGGGLLRAGHDADEGVGEQAQQVQGLFVVAVQVAGQFGEVDRGVAVEQAGGEERGLQVGAAGLVRGCPVLDGGEVVGLG